MRRKSLLASALCALAFSGLSAGGASAGEITGNGKKQGYSQGRSLCKFSGQNDKPNSTDPMDPGGRVQSYGYSFVRNGLKAVVPSPSVGCNPTAPPPE